MALWKSIELASNTGLSRAHISVYVSRGKIVLNKDKFFDTENLINIAWLEKINYKSAPLEELQKSEKKEVVKSNFKSISEKRDIPSEEKKDQRILNFQISEKLKNEKLEEEIKLLKLKTEKDEGRNIPIDFVQRLFELHFKNVSAEFFYITDNYTSIIVNKLQGNRNDLAEFRMILKKTINDAIEEAKKTSKKDIQIIAKKIIDD